MNANVFILSQAEIVGADAGRGLWLRTQEQSSCQDLKLLLFSLFQRKSAQGIQNAKHNPNDLQGNTAVFDQLPKIK